MHFARRLSLFVVYHIVLVSTTIGLYYKSQSDYSDRLPSTGILWSYSSVDRIKCADKCVQDVRCHSFFYKPISDDFNCHGFQFRLADPYPSMTKYNAVGWRYYPMRKEFCEHYGYTYKRELDMCFKLHNSEVTINTATSICQKEGGKLVTLHTPQRMKNMIHYLNTYVSGSCYWIGISDSLVEGTWVWNNGEELRDDMIENFQENNYDGDFSYSRFSADCACIYSDPNALYDMTDENCNSLKPFICEIAR